MVELTELLAQAEAEGIPLTKRRLWHWSETGLIQPAVVSYRGRRGVQSTYAPDTLDRARVITQAFNAQRDVNAARLALMRVGFEVDLKPLFARSLDSVRALRARVERDRQAVEQDNDRYATVDEEPFDPHDTPLIRKVYKALPKRGLSPQDVYGSIVFAMTRLYEPDGDDLRDYLGDVLPADHYDFDSALFRAISRLMLFPLDRGPRDILAVLRPHFDPDNLEELAVSYGSARFRELDRELHTMLLIINALLAVPQMLAGKGPTPTFTLDRQPPEAQALLLLVWSSLMLSPTLRSGFEQVVTRHNELMQE